MFTLANTPFGTDEPFVSASFLIPPVSGASFASNIYLIVAEPASQSTLGITETAGGVTTTTYCCTTALSARGACGTASVGTLISTAATGAPPSSLPQIAAFPIAMTTGGSGNAKFTVRNSVPQLLIVIACDASGGRLPAGPAVEVTATFRNPYGYLPGTLVGLLPWYGVLLAAYTLLALIFIIALVRNREFILPLQWLVLGVIAIGLFEMMLSLGTYDTKNKTGVPTPCNICAVTGDYMSAVVANVLKRTASRVLLLAVAMGFGVVYPSLPSRSTLGLIILGITYAIAGLLDEVERETTYDVGPSMWELPVVLLDLAFLALINVYHERTTKGLAAAKQEEKLKMYRSLVRVVLANVAAHIILTITVIGIRSGSVTLDWRALFFLQHFWDLLYFIALCAGAYIWAPGPTAYRYAWYAQPGADEESAAAGGAGGGDVGAEAVEIEMPASSSSKVVANAAAKAAAPPPGAFAIAAEDEEDEEDAVPSMLEESDRQRLAALPNAVVDSSAVGGGGGGAGGGGGGSKPTKK